jgi:hypothetical protein
MSVLFQISMKMFEVFLQNAGHLSVGPRSWLRVLTRTNWLEAWKRKLPRNKKACNEKREVGIKQNQPREGKRDETNGPTGKKNLAVTLSDISDS